MCHYYQSNLTLLVLRVLLWKLLHIGDIANIQKVATNGRKVQLKLLKLRMFAASKLGAKMERSESRGT